MSDLSSEIAELQEKVNSIEIIKVVYGTLGFTSSKVTLVKIINGIEIGPTWVDEDVTYLIYNKATEDDGSLGYSYYKNLTPVREVTMARTNSIGEYSATYNRLSDGNYVMFAIIEGYDIIGQTFFARFIVEYNTFTAVSAKVAVYCEDEMGEQILTTIPGGMGYAIYVANLDLPNDYDAYKASGASPVRSGNMVSGTNGTYTTSYSRLTGDYRFFAFPLVEGYVVEYR